MFTAYACHGSWSEDGSSFLIAAPLARKSGGARRYCFAYTPAPGTDSSSPGGGGGGIGGGGVGAPGGGTVLSVTQSCRRRRTGDGGLDAFNTAHQHASTAPLIADHHATWTFNLTAHGTQSQRRSKFGYFFMVEGTYFWLKMQHGGA